MSYSRGKFNESDGRRNSAQASTSTSEQVQKNSDEFDVEKILEDVVINNCGHDENERKFFCADCFQMFCFRCLKLHEPHSYQPIKEIISDENFMKLESNLCVLGNEIKDAVHRVETEKIKFESNYDNAKEQIASNFETLMTELSTREETLKKNVDDIVDTKLEELNSQYETCIKMNEEEEILIPCETSDIYFKPGDVDICTDLIKNLGFVYSGASSEKTTVSGLALNTIIINYPCGFIVRCYDIKGNKCFTGGEDIRATLTCPDEVTHDVKITDLQNGLYQGVVSTQEVKDYYRLSITIRGNQIFKEEPILRSKYYTNLETILKDPKVTCSFKQNPDICCFRDAHCDINGRLLVTDAKFHCFHIYDHNFENPISIGGPGETDGAFQNPHGITVDNEKRIIVVDSGNHRVQVFSYDGEFILKFGSVGSEKSYFRFPEGVATNSKGIIAVSDKGNNRIQLFDKFGKFITATKSLANSKSIEHPYGLCFEEDDILLVSCLDSKNVAVVKLKVTQNSGEVQFEEDYESIYFPAYKYKNHFGLIKSKEFYILTSLQTMEDDVSSVCFYNTRTKDMIKLPFPKQTPYSTAVSPEGYLYIIVQKGSYSELQMYKGNPL